MELRLDVLLANLRNRGPDILAAIGAAVILFVIQNNASVSIQFLNQELVAPLAGVVAGAYVLGMLSGWTVLGLLRRSVHRVTEPSHHNRAGVLSR